MRLTVLPQIYPLGGRLMSNEQLIKELRENKDDIMEYARSRGVPRPVVERLMPEVLKQEPEPIEVDLDPDADPDGPAEPVEPNDVD
jgi:hypothetical protein